METALDETPSNVISLHRKRTSGVAPTYSGGAPVRRWILKLDCLIEAPHISEIHKMALELHYQGSRYAFVEYRDVDAERRCNLEDLLNMGTISLFVPDLNELSEREQATLGELVARDSASRPLLLAGSTRSYSELRAEGKVNPELLASLTRAYIKLTRPFSEYKAQGLIHYFLDSLSENPT
ncbi:MAG: hypothetical protein HC902_12555 [Calothrix sp. SM1_5_4]|nr:hypothetical protein [Calothrix sp. SM1_5_4]